MAEIHNGTATTLAGVPKADCSNNDTARIWLNRAEVELTFDSTGTNATDISDPPSSIYYIRPDDYATEGVWIENVGSREDIRLSANQMFTGQLTSTNWAAAAGSQYDLDLAKFRLGGSNVDAAGSAAGIFWGLDSGKYKGYVGDGSNVYWKFDGSTLTISVNANAGTGAGVIYKGGARWLYDFNPTDREGKNLFLGVEAGNLTMGGGASSGDASYNIGVGYQALISLTTGARNIAIGYKAAYGNLTATGEIAIGVEALYSCTGGFYNIAIGDQALYNTLYTGNNNIGIGSYALGQNTSGDKNIAIGECAGAWQAGGGDYPLQTPENSIYIGYRTRSGSDHNDGEDAIDNEIVIGYTAIGNGSDTVTLGNTSIGELHCQVALTVDSDKRIKRNIHPSLIGLSFINALNPITFQPKNPFDYPEKIKPPEYKDRTIKEKDKDGKEKTKLIKADKRPSDNDRVYLGLSAQEVEQVMSAQGIDLELVSTSNRGKKAITYESLIMPLITAVQEGDKKQDVNFQALSQRMDEIENRLN